MLWAHGPTGPIFVSLVLAWCLSIPVSTSRCPDSVSFHVARSSVPALHHGTNVSPPLRVILATTSLDEPTSSSHVFCASVGVPRGADHLQMPGFYSGGGATGGVCARPPPTASTLDQNCPVERVPARAVQAETPETRGRQQHPARPLVAGSRICAAEEALDQVKVMSGGNSSERG